jgi:hypothetical protein
MRLKKLEEIIEANKLANKKEKMRREYDLLYGAVRKKFLLLPTVLNKEARWLETAYVYYKYKYDDFYEDNLLGPTNELIPIKFVDEDAYFWYEVKRAEFVDSGGIGGIDFDWRIMNEK